MQKNYIIPYGERFTQIGQYGHKRVVMSVNNIGLVVKYSEDILPTDQEVSQHLRGWVDRKRFYTQADSVQEAISIFHQRPECNIGGEHKAWVIQNSEKNPVIEYSGCKWMGNKDYFNCNRYADPGDEDSLNCVLDGNDEPPCDCPIFSQQSEMEWRSEINCVDGIWVKQYFKTVIPMAPITKPIQPISAVQN